ncbi:MULTISPECIES: ABC transporter permease [Nonomuraea]|uniref:Transport permease protein n=3 Tax=Nonomuraea TaxID=83681 RepID=A0A7W5V1K4_9ACTN|nr:ABC transporter permease [Nonomuraea dietziae]MBB3727094.1 ABC-2 type transport system permease protein [Nonomuraea dietziae]
MSTLALGVRRGLIEQASIMRDGRELSGQLAGLVMFVLLMLWIGDNPAGGGVGMSAFMAVGFMAFTVFSAGTMSLPLLIATDREEGALLRLRALPRGLRVYVTGRAVSLMLHIAGHSAIMLALGAAVGGLGAPAHWPTLLWSLALGTLAVVPLGTAIGAMLPSAKTAAAVIGVPTMLLMICSGVMLPVRMMPEAVQWVAQAFPLYWQGHALRAAFFDSPAGELHGVWQLGTAAIVMGAWALAGMVLAPWLLRRVTRK